METMDTIDAFYACFWTKGDLYTPKHPLDRSSNEWGARGRRFKSSRPDHKNLTSV